MTIQKKLKILQILRAPTGGLWRHVVDLSTELVNRGHEVGIVLNSGFSDSQTDQGLAVLGPRLKLGVHRIPISRQPSFGDFSAALKIGKLARQLRIDILHGHGSKGGLFVRLAGIGSNRRVAIYTPHGGVLHYDAASRTGKLVHKAEKWLLPATDAILFESAFAKRAFLAQIGNPSCVTPVIHNGLRPDEFKSIPAESGAFEFVFVGELRAIKGLSFLLEALTRIKRPDGQLARLVIVGGGPDEEALKSQIERLGLGARVYMAGVQPAQKMFAKGQCVVIPSLAESLPYIVLEAVAAQKQVITTRVGGIDEIFGPTAPALIPAGNSEALAVAMQSFLDDPKLAELEVATRLKFVRERFSLAHMTDSIEAHYTKALSKG